MTHLPALRERLQGLVHKAGVTDAVRDSVLTANCRVCPVDTDNNRADYTPDILCPRSSFIDHALRLFKS
jgi:hypothetical protein